MKRSIRIMALEGITEALTATNEAEKATDEKPEEKVEEKPEEKVEEKPEEKPEEKKVEDKKFENLYSVMSNTPAGSFEITNDEGFNKAANAVTNDIANTFKGQPNVDQIVAAFKQAIDAQDKAEIQNAFNMISGYKKLQKNTEKQAFYLINKNLIKQS